MVGNDDILEGTADTATGRPPYRRLALLAIGFGCMVGYSRMASLGFAGYLSKGVIESVDPWYALRAAVCVAVLALLAVNGTVQRFKMGPASLVAAMAAAIAAPIACTADVVGELGPLVAVLGGASSAVLMYTWMLEMSTCTVRQVLGAGIAGLLVSGAIILGVPHLDRTLGLAVTVAAALAAGTTAVLADPGLAACRPDGPLTRSQAARIPWLTVVMMLACGFLATVVFGVAKHLTWLYDWQPNFIAFAVAIVAELVAVTAIMLRHGSWMHYVWIPLLVLLAIALGFSCVSVRESIQVAVGLMLASVFCTHFLHWIVFPALLHTVKVPRACLSALVLIVANGSLATMAGDALGAALPHSMQNLGGVAGIMLLILSALFAAAYLAFRSMFGTVGSRMPAATAIDRDESEAAPQAEAPAEPGTPVDALKSHMDVLAGEYGLTPRETEVALLTVQGFSCAYIADKLVVSNSTVRFHQQNIYRKFDVHSRNELIEAVNAPSDRT